MTRYKLTIEYDGGPFVGWQRQENGFSVQQALEEAVEGFCQETVTVFGAGRTDAGVHAWGQVAHINIAKDTSAKTVRDALNDHLRPQPIVVLAAEAVAADFDARFSARQRAYEYRIIIRSAPLALDHGRAWHLIQDLDHGAMAAAAKVLVGKHDFTSFRAVNCQADSPVKTLDSLEVSRDGPLILITARARSFLHNQVRIIAGTLKSVGEGKWGADDVSQALAARDRARAGPTAPAHGLYLTEVLY